MTRPVFCDARRAALAAHGADVVRRALAGRPATCLPAAQDIRVACQRLTGVSVLCACEFRPGGNRPCNTAVGLAALDAEASPCPI
jgi:hypothetical protein